MSIYEVGKPYSPTKKHWPEGVDYNFRAGRHELRLFMRTPNRQELTDTETGEARFALTVEKDIIYFCYRFGLGDWGDCGFSIHLVPKDERILPEPPATEYERALLSVLLIDAETGIVKVIRAVSLSPQFTRKLHQAIRDQASRPFPADYDRQGEEVYRRYTSAQLVERAIIRCRGGE